MRRRTIFVLGSAAVDWVLLVLLGFFFRPRPRCARASRSICMQISRSVRMGQVGGVQRRPAPLCPPRLALCARGAALTRPRGRSVARPTGSPCTNWTRLVLPPVLSGHVSSFPRPAGSQQANTAEVVETGMAEAPVEAAQAAAPPPVFVVVLHPGSEVLAKTGLHAHKTRGSKSKNSDAVTDLVAIGVRAAHAAHAPPALSFVQSDLGVGPGEAQEPERRGSADSATPESGWAGLGGGSTARLPAVGGQGQGKTFGDAGGDADDTNAYWMDTAEAPPECMTAQGPAGDDGEEASPHGHELRRAVGLPLGRVVQPADLLPVSTAPRPRPAPGQTDVLGYLF